MGGIGPVRSIQPDVSHHVVRSAVAVEVRGDDRSPPAGASRRKARLFGPIFESDSSGIVKVLHVAPFQGEQQVWQVVTVDIAPQRSCDHSDVLESWDDRRGDILKLAALIAQQSTAGWRGITTGRNSPADKKIESTVTIEIRG